MSSRQVLDVARGGRGGVGKRKYYAKGAKGALAKVKADVRQVKAMLNKTIEWKRQYFFSAPSYSSTLGTLAQGNPLITVSPFFQCITNWLFQQAGQQGNAAQWPTGDGMVGTTVTPKYLEIGFTLKSFGQYQLTTDQKMPLYPYRVVIWQIRGNDYTSDINSYNTFSKHILLFDKSQMQQLAVGNAGYLQDPINAKLAREFGGLGKPMHVLYDEIVNPDVTMTGSATTINGQHCHKVKVDLSKCQKIQFAELPSSNAQGCSTYGNQVAYETGAIYVGVFNNWDPTQITDPEYLIYNNQNLSFNGCLIYTDA